MKIPDKFKKWFSLYGVMDDYYLDEYNSRVERIAYRAYKKGMHDAKTVITITDKNSTGIEYGAYGKWFTCPKCGENLIASYFSYCPGCSRKIIWKITKK